jgi:DNA (cytosine-5)-methyltransferase 1
MKYGSVCSGIEAATAAWHSLGWQPAFFSEIEPFPRAVLAHHYPTVPLHGDFTTIGADQYGAIDLLVGGTPCQSFSVAGLRGGLDDDRGNLALEFLRLADRKRPRWVVWENVPGVLSSNGGRDFGSILGGLGELGYGFAYRVLDAQYFGVAQRRRRVFVVGYLGDWRSAAAVLFERHSMSGHPAPRREKGQRVADSLTVGANQCSGFPGDFTDCPWPTDIAPTLNAAFGAKQGLEDQHVNAGCPLFVPAVANAITASLANAATGHNKDENVIAFDAYNQSETDGVSKTVAARNDQDTASCVAQPIMAGGPVSGNQSGDFVVTPFDTTQISSPHNYSNPQSGDPCHPLAAGAHPPAVAFEANMSFATPDTSGVNPTLTRRHHASVAIASAVRRLTPRECERLQGFPDDWTLIPYRNKPADQCPDGPRYKALGNSMAVPVMRWIGERIAAVEAFNAP